MDRLRRLGGRDLTVKMIDLFLSHVQTVLMQALAAFQSNDLEGVERAAHSMKSSAGNVGATEVRQLAEQAEDAAHKHDVATLQHLVPDLAKAFDRVKVELAEARNRETS